MFLLEVSNLSIGREHEVLLPIVTIPVDSKTTTLKDVIEMSVKEQYRTLATANGYSLEQVQERFDQQYLSNQDIEDQSKEGKISLNVGENILEVDVAVAKALSGFKRSRYKVFVDSQELTSLNSVVDVKSDSKIKFLRLLPLIGG